MNWMIGVQELKGKERKRCMFNQEILGKWLRRIQELEYHIELSSLIVKLGQIWGYLKMVIAMPTT